MAKDLKYFMRKQEPEIVTVPGPASIKDDDGNPVELEIRVLTQEEINHIYDGYRRRSIATDKKGNPFINNGEAVWKTERDSDRAARHIIAEALVYPNLKDKDLMAYYGCVDLTDMPFKVFPRPDEYAHVSRAVFAALGIVDAPDDELVDDAKN